MGKKILIFLVLCVLSAHALDTCGWDPNCDCDTASDADNACTDCLDGYFFVDKNAQCYTCLA